MKEGDDMERKILMQSSFHEDDSLTYKIATNIINIGHEHGRQHQISSFSILEDMKG